MIKIKDIMTKEVVTINPSANLFDAAKKVADKSVSSLIVDERNKPIAILTETDIVRGVLAKKTKVKDIMSQEFMEISPHTPFSEISKTLRTEKIKRFPVMDNGKLIGLITETDVIEATRDFTRFHQIMQEIILTVFGLATAFFLFYFSQLRSTIFG